MQINTHIMIFQNALLNKCGIFFLRYFKSHTLLVEQRLQKDKLPEVVRESDFCLRYEHLHSHQEVFTTFTLDTK